MHSRLQKLASAAAGLALIVTPTMTAAAPTSAIQPINPLVAVSLFGTQASAQTVCSAGASAAAAAGAAAAAQGQAGCVLPARDAPPPVSEVGPPPPPPPPGGDFGINWILLGLGALALLGGLSTLFDDDDDDDEALSPA
jgi:hypothetical protein